MAADKLVIEAMAVESALVVQIQNLQSLKRRISEMLDRKGQLMDAERERLQSLVNLAVGAEAFVDRPQPRQSKRKKGEGNDEQ